MECRISTSENEYSFNIRKSSEEGSVIESRKGKHSVVWTESGAFIDGKYHEFEVKNDVNGLPRSVVISGEEIPLTVNSIDRVKSKDRKRSDAAEGVIRACLAGKVISVSVSEGDAVREGQLLLILEAMKMENEILAPFSGTVRRISALSGKNVLKDEVLIELDA